MSRTVVEIISEARTLASGQSLPTLLASLEHLEEIAPEPDDAQMREWSLMVKWVEEELIKRLGCEDAHTDWVLSDAFADVSERTSLPFFKDVAS